MSLLGCWDVKALFCEDLLQFNDYPTTGVDPSQDPLIQHIVCLGFKFF